MLGEVEVRHDEPGEQEDGAKTKQVEGHQLEEGHVEHIAEAAHAVVVPFLEDTKETKPPVITVMTNSL